MSDADDTESARSFAWMLFLIYAKTF